MQTILCNSFYLFDIYINTCKYRFVLLCLQKEFYMKDLEILRSAIRDKIKSQKDIAIEIGIDEATLSTFMSDSKKRVIGKNTITMIENWMLRNQIEGK